MKKSRLRRKIAVRSGCEHLVLFLKDQGILSEEMEILRQPGHSAWNMGDGTILELYTPGEHPDYLFEKNDIVLSFKVQDLDATVRDLVRKGVAIPGGIQNILPSYACCYARFSNGMVIGFYEENN
ncbi:MAG TPA: hypothetical protein VGN00_22395 [Puia sp.]|jgi:hypothetical protein